MKRRLLRYLSIALVAAAVAVPVGRATDYDGYKSGYPELHATLEHGVPGPVATTPDRGFHWRDAAIGAATAAGSIFLLAGAAVVLTRRRTAAVAMEREPFGHDRVTGILKGEPQ